MPGWEFKQQISIKTITPMFMFMFIWFYTHNTFMSIANNLTLKSEKRKYEMARGPGIGTGL